MKTDDELPGNDVDYPKYMDSADVALSKKKGVETIVFYVQVSDDLRNDTKPNPNPSPRLS